MPPTPREKPRATGHAEHFLERLDRAPRVLVDEALALYRDPDRVVWVLKRAATGDAPRVALALGDDGPYVVVTRDGHFVTCLAEGMTTGDLPIVTRAKLDVASADFADVRARRQVAVALTAPSGLDPTDVVRLVYHRADRLTREELVAISAWQPFVAADYLEMLGKIAAQLEDGRDVMARIRTRSPRRDVLLDMHWKHLHAMGHIFVVLGMSERVVLDRLAAFSERSGQTPFTIAGVREGHLGIALKATWYAARFGKRGLGMFKAALARADDPALILEAALALTAIGLRHSSLRGDARRAIAARDGADPSDSLEAMLVRSALRVLDDPETATKNVLSIGRDLYVVRARHAPDGSPYKAESAADVPDDRAALALLNSDMTTYRSHHDLSLDLQCVPLIARAAAEDFYWPKAMAEHAAMPSSPSRALYFLEDTRYRDEPERRATPKVGRNEACSCGSGKKFKKCCGK